MSFSQKIVARSVDTNLEVGSNITTGDIKLAPAQVSGKIEIGTLTGRLGAITIGNETNGAAVNILGNETSIQANGLLSIESTTGNVNIEADSDVNLSSTGGGSVKINDIVVSGNQITGVSSFDVAGDITLGGNIINPSSMNISPVGELDLIGGTGLKLRSTSGRLAIEAETGGLTIDSAFDIFADAVGEIILTAGEKIDTNATLGVNINAGEEVAINAGKTVRIDATEGVTVLAGKSANLTATDAVAISAGKALRIDANQGITIDSGQSVNIAAIDAVIVSTEYSVGLTASGPIGIDSGTQVSIDATQGLVMNAGTSANLTATEALAMNAGTSASLTAAGAVGIDSGTQVSIDATQGLVMNAGTSANLTATEALAINAGTSASLTAAGAVGIEAGQDVTIDSTVSTYIGALIDVNITTGKDIILVPGSSFDVRPVTGGIYYKTISNGISTNSGTNLNMDAATFSRYTVGTDLLIQANNNMDLSSFAGRATFRSRDANVVFSSGTDMGLEATTEMDIHSGSTLTVRGNLATEIRSDAGTLTLAALQDDINIGTDNTSVNDTVIGDRSAPGTVYVKGFDMSLRVRNVSLYIRGSSTAGSWTGETTQCTVSVWGAMVIVNTTGAWALNGGASGSFVFAPLNSSQQLPEPTPGSGDVLCVCGDNGFLTTTPTNVVTASMLPGDKWIRFYLGGQTITVAQVKENSGIKFTLQYLTLFPDKYN